MLLYLKIKPNQRFDKVCGSENEWEIKVKARAVDGKANDHLINYLSQILKLPKSKIRLRKGLTSRIKCLEIDAASGFVNDCLASAASLHKPL